jgi:hypothetical protein
VITFTEADLNVFTKSTAVVIACGFGITNRLHNKQLASKASIPSNTR